MMLGKLLLDDPSVHVDSLGGIPTYRVTGKYSGPIFGLGRPSPAHLTIWAAAADLLVLRMQVEGTVPGTVYKNLVSLEPDDVFASSIYDFHDFDDLDAILDSVPLP